MKFIPLSFITEEPNVIISKLPFMVIIDDKGDRNVKVNIRYTRKEKKKDSLAIKTRRPLISEWPAS